MFYCQNHTPNKDKLHQYYGVLGHWNSITISQLILQNGFHSVKCEYGHTPSVSWIIFKLVDPTATPIRYGPHGHQAMRPIQSVSETRLDSNFFIRFGQIQQFLALIISTHSIIYLCVPFFFVLVVVVHLSILSPPITSESAGQREIHNTPVGVI